MSLFGSMICAHLLTISLWHFGVICPPRSTSSDVHASWDRDLSFAKKGTNPNLTGLQPVLGYVDGDKAGTWDGDSADGRPEREVEPAIWVHCM